jgi:regulator of replication initiation timing
MDKKETFDLMQKVGRELEDLKHSQEAVIKKITQIEAHNINLGDNDLDNLLADIHEHVAENLARVEDAASSFQQKTDKYAADNSAALAAVA